MAITIVTEPKDLQPAYNDTYIVVDSTDVGLPSYRYIAELYINNVKLVAFKITPEFGTGYGRLNMTKLVSGYLTNTLRHVDTQDFVDGNEDYLNGLNLSYVNVKVEWGEEYQPLPFEFDDYLWAGSTSVWANFSDPSINPQGISQTMLVGSDEPDYSAGDVITITQDAAPSDAEYRVELEGNHTVLDVFNDSGDWYVVLDLPWIGSGAASSGIAVFADGRKTINLEKLTAGEYVFFNAAERFASYKDWSDTAYTLNGTTKKFLTTIPRDKPWRVRTDSLVFIQGYQIGSKTIQYLLGSSVDDSVVIDETGVILYDMSPRRLSVSEDYSVRLLNNSETLQFVVDDKCYGFADVEVVFMDRFGSFIPIQFNLKRTQSIDVKRETYKKDITTDEMYVYNTYDGGDEDLFIEVGKRFTLRSDKLSLNESTMMEELVSSPFTIVRFGTDEYLRCKIVTGSLEIKDEYFEGIRFYDIDIEITNKDVVNW
jgi:hypothetical protein